MFSLSIEHVVAHWLLLSFYPLSGINIMLICFDFQDGVRFYIYFDSDYELDADSVEEKNKVSAA